MTNPDTHAFPWIPEVVDQQPTEIDEDQMESP